MGSLPRKWWVGYDREVSRLSSAPEFDADGSWPPVSTPWLALRWELFEATPNEASTNKAIHYLNYFGLVVPEDERDALSLGFLYGVVFGRQIETNVVFKGRKGKPRFSYDGLFDPESGRYREEVRRMVHYARWARNDPVTQLPPDAVQEKSYSVSTGLSIERSQTLAKSLGVGAGATHRSIHATLTKQLEQQFGLKVEITEQEQRTATLTLANQSGGYRLFALWRVEHLITVDALAAVPLAPKTSALQRIWLPRASVEFVTNIDPVITYVDVNLQKKLAR
jgi:hypothetical protein